MAFGTGTETESPVGIEELCILDEDEDVRFALFFFAAQTKITIIIIKTDMTELIIPIYVPTFDDEDGGVSDK